VVYGSGSLLLELYAGRLELHPEFSTVSSWETPVIIRRTRDG